MKPAREAGTDIREISLKSRKAEYVYLMRVAQECMTRESSLQKNGMDARKAETAVLYRDNECAIPLIDLWRGRIFRTGCGMQSCLFHTPYGSGCREYHTVCNESERY